MNKFKQQSLVILGKKVRLRLIQEKDLEKLRRWRNQNRFCFLNSSYIAKEVQRKWFKGYQEKKDDLIFIIETLVGKPIGTVSLYRINPSAKEAEYGRMVIGDLESRRKGFALDASKALIGWGFSALGLQKITLESLANNQPAIRLYQKIRFQGTPTEGNNPTRVISMVIGRDSL